MTKAGLAVLLPVVLLVPATSLAAGTPHRFLAVEGASACGAFSPGHDPFFARVSFADLTCVLGRARLGVALGDYEGRWWTWDAGTLLPVRVGYTIWSQPRQTARWYAAVPDVYVQASVGWLGWWHAPAGLKAKLSLCCDVDYYGLGIGAELGAYSLHTKEGAHRGVSVGLRARGLAFRLGW